MLLSFPSFRSGDNLRSRTPRVHLIDHAEGIQQYGKVLLRRVHLLADEADLDAMVRHLNIAYHEIDFSLGSRRTLGFVER